MRRRHRNLGRLARWPFEPFCQMNGMDDAGKYHPLSKQKIDTLVGKNRREKIIHHELPQGSGVHHQRANGSNWVQV